MKSIVYKTTNIINGKFYIGVHSKGDPNYFGSGKLLKQAIKKYGRENFTRETLQEFSNEKDAYEYERLIINIDMVENHNCYNVIEGGGNPPTFYAKDHPNFNKIFSNETRLKMSESAKVKLFSESHRENISKVTKGVNNPMYGRNHSQESKNKISNTRKEKGYCGENHSFYGKTHNEETKEKIRQSHLGKRASKETKEKIKKSHQKFLYIINGNKYISSREASINEGIYHTTILYRCNSDKFPNFIRTSI